MNLQEQIDLMQCYIDGTRAGTWRWNIQTGETLFNEQWAEIVGYTLEELMPISIDTWVSLTHPHDLEKSNQLLKRCFSGESEYYDCEARMRHKDGHWVWVHDRGKIISRDAAGEPLLMAGSHTDISDRKHTEVELLKSKQKLQLFIDHAPVAIAMFDTRMRYIAVSSRWIDDYKLHEKDIIGRSHYELFPEIPKHWKKFHQRGLKGESLSNPAERFERADGSVQWIRWELQPWYINGGDIGGIVIFTEDVTSLKLMETKYQTVFDHTGTSMAVIEEDGTFSLVNKIFADLAGYTPQSIVGRNFEEMLMDSDKKMVAKYHKDRINEIDVPDSYEINFVTATGNTGTALLNASYIPQTRQTIVSLIDITQQKIYEQKLLDSEKSYRTLFEDSIDMIHVVDERGLIVDANNAELQTLGYSREEFIGKSLFELIDPKYLENSQKKFKSVFEGHALKGYETAMLTRDGERIYVEVSVTPYIKNSHTLFARAIIRDITDRKNKELKLLQSAVVFDNLSEGIIITDATANITAVNPAFTRITGYSADEALGKNPKFISSRRHDKLYFEQMWQSINSYGEWQGEIWNRRKNGEAYPEWMSLSTINDSDGNLMNYLAVFSDISKMKKTEKELLFLSHYDSLTQLPNRLLLHERLEHSLERAKRKNTHIAVIFIDLDRFKDINDSFGHPFGDQILVKIADKLHTLMRQDDTVSRISGDEFVVILEDIKSLDNAMFAAEKILKIISEPLTVDNYNLTMTGSLGIAMSPTDGTDSITLLKNSDTALYKAKQLGRGTISFFSEAMASSAFEVMHIHTDLNTALEKNEFRVYYQPQVNIKTKKTIGAEALVRWERPEHGLVSPDYFIPVAEETGLIVPIGRFVLKEACRDMKKWLDDGMDLKYIAVNISARQITHNNIVENVLEALKESQLDPSHLELEITESAIMREEQNYISVLSDLKAIGVRLSIDDFGTGYSSLLRLKNMPIDKLKIDQSFVKGIPYKFDDTKIVNAIIALATSLELDLIAEGVETQVQSDYLLKNGCEKVQGYLYSRPVPADEFKQLLSMGK